MRRIHRGRPVREDPLRRRGVPGVRLVGRLSVVATAVAFVAWSAGPRHLDAGAVG